MGPDISFGMKLWRLLDAFHLRNFRKKLGQQPRCIEKLETAARRAFDKQLGQFVANPLPGDLVDFGCQPEMAAKVASSIA